MDVYHADRKTWLLGYVRAIGNSPANKWRVLVYCPVEFFRTKVGVQWFSVKRKALAAGKIVAPGEHGVAPLALPESDSEPGTHTGFVHPRFRPVTAVDDSQRNEPVDPEQGLLHMLSSPHPAIVQHALSVVSCVLCSPRFGLGDLEEIGVKAADLVRVRPLLHQPTNVPSAHRVAACIWLWAGFATQITCGLLMTAARASPQRLSATVVLAMVVGAMPKPIKLHLPEPRRLCHGLLGLCSHHAALPALNKNDAGTWKLAARACVQMVGLAAVTYRVRRYCVSHTCCGCDVQIVEHLEGTLVVDDVDHHIATFGATALTEATTEAWAFACEVLVANMNHRAVHAAAQRWLPLLVHTAVTCKFKHTNHESHLHIISACVSAASTIIEVVLEDQALFREVFVPVWMPDFEKALHLSKAHPGLAKNRLGQPVASLRYLAVKCIQAFIEDPVIVGTPFVTFAFVSAGWRGQLTVAVWPCVCIHREERGKIARWLPSMCAIGLKRPPRWPTVRRVAVPWGAAGVVPRDYSIPLLPVKADVASSIRCVQLWRALPLLPGLSLTSRSFTVQEVATCGVRSRLTLGSGMQAHVVEVLGATGGELRGRRGQLHKEYRSDGCAQAHCLRHRSSDPHR